MVAVTFFAFVTGKISDTSNEANHQAAEDVANIALNEISFARTVSDGYSRTFKMPATIDNKPYQIAIVDNHEIVINFTGIESVKFLPDNVTGNLSFGNNLITKKKGFVNVRPVP